MKQLLSILILYSYNRKGISNAELKETLWDDKSEESYYNNRGVNIKKIRTCISKVDDIEIVSSNGSWSINIKNSLCDWFGTLAFIESVNPYEMNTEQIDKFISTAMKGQILPEMRYDWTDRFKGQYADLIIGSLTKVSEKNSHARSPELRIRIADAILSFDSLDEYAIRLKCRALIAQKRLGIAQSTFKNFTQEYKRLMGEDFETNFNEFVK
jgi:two-component SAPR family response regulator